MNHKQSLFPRRLEKKHGLFFANAQNKGIVGIFVLVLILVIAVAGGAYYLGRATTKPKVTETQQATPATPSPSKASATEGDPTANWKTYENTKLGFSFMYPSQFTLVKENKIFEDDNSKNFDGQKVHIIQYFFEFTTGKLITGDMLGDPGLKGGQDESSFGINIVTTNGQTMTQAYNNKSGLGGEITKVTLLDKTGNADEVANISGIGNYIKTYRKGDYFYEIVSPQNNLVLPDKSDDILKYMDQILSTFKFTSQ